jgi:hypothetical protein
VQHGGEDFMHGCLTFSQLAGETLSFEDSSQLCQYLGSGANSYHSTLG